MDFFIQYKKQFFGIIFVILAVVGIHHKTKNPVLHPSFDKKVMTVDEFFDADFKVIETKYKWDKMDFIKKILPTANALSCSGFGLKRYYKKPKNIKVKSMKAHVYPISSGIKKHITKKRIIASEGGVYVTKGGNVYFVEGNIKDHYRPSFWSSLLLGQAHAQRINMDSCESYKPHATHYTVTRIPDETLRSFIPIGSHGVGAIGLHGVYQGPNVINDHLTFKNIKDLSFDSQDGTVTNNGIIFHFNMDKHKDIYIFKITKDKDGRVITEYHPDVDPLHLAWTIGLHSDSASYIDLVHRFLIQENNRYEKEHDRYRNYITTLRSIKHIFTGNGFKKNGVYVKTPIKFLDPEVVQQFQEILQVAIEEKVFNDRGMKLWYDDMQEYEDGSIEKLLTPEQREYFESL